MSEQNALSGKTVRWTFDSGPMAGKSFEHEFRDDGTVAWQVVDADMKGHEKKYSATKIADDVIVASYLSASGYTLTTVLNTATKKLAGVASGTNQKGEKEWFPVSGTFEISG